MSLLLLIEQNELSSLKILVRKIKEKNYTYLNFNAPLWSITFPFIVVGLITSWCLFDETIIKSNNSFAQKIIDSISIEVGINSLQTLSILLSLIFFIVRDFLIMLFLQISSKKKRIGAAFILYLFLLYVVFPGLTSTLGNHTILQIFIPLPIAGSFLFPLVECALIFYIIRSKFK